MLKSVLSSKSTPKKKRDQKADIKQQIRFKEFTDVSTDPMDTAPTVTKEQFEILQHELAV